MVFKHDRRFVKHRCGPAAKGFTLIELLIVIAVAALLIGIAVPSMKVFLDNAGLNSAASELHAAVSRARQEAIARGTFVSIIAKGPDWSSGYQIFVNPLDSATFVSSDQIGGTGTSVVSAAIVADVAPSGWMNVTWPGLTSDGTVPVTLYTFNDEGRPYLPGGVAKKAADPSRVQVCTLAMKCKELWVDALGRIQIISF